MSAKDTLVPFTFGLFFISLHYLWLCMCPIQPSVQVRIRGMPFCVPHSHRVEIMTQCTDTLRAHINSLKQDQKLNHWWSAKDFSKVLSFSLISILLKSNKWLFPSYGYTLDWMCCEWLKVQVKTGGKRNRSIKTCQVRRLLHFWAFVMLWCWTESSSEVTVCIS